MTLPVDEFPRRFLLPVLPPGFVRIPHFGILSTRNRSALLELSRQLIKVEPQPKAPNALTDTPTEQDGLWHCPQCGGPMRLLDRLTATQLRLRSPPCDTFVAAL